MVVRPFSCWIRELYPIWQYANSSVKSLLIENQKTDAQFEHNLHACKYA